MNVSNQFPENGTEAIIHPVAVHRFHRNPKRARGWKGWIFIDTITDEAEPCDGTMLGEYRFSMDNFTCEMEFCRLDPWQAAKTASDAGFNILAEALDKFRRMTPNLPDLNSLDRDGLSVFCIFTDDPEKQKKQMRGCDLAIISANAEFLEEIERDYKERNEPFSFLFEIHSPTDVIKQMRSAELVLIKNSDVQTFRNHRFVSIEC